MGIIYKSSQGHMNTAISSSSDPDFALEGEVASRREKSPALLARVSHQASGLASPVNRDAASVVAGVPAAGLSAICVACGTRSNFP